MRLAAELCALMGALLALLAESVQAASSNRTIDDNSGDSVTGLKPVFQPADKWNYGPDCPGCFIQPDKSQVLDNSWHDTTAHMEDSVSLTLSFTGTAIYVFGIVPNFVQYADTTYNLTFTLDGQIVGTYFHQPDSSTTMLYNVPLYTNSQLDNTNHTLVVQPVSGGVAGTILMFDYAIYTHEDVVSTITSVSQQTTTATAVVTIPQTDPTTSATTSSVQASSSSSSTSSGTSATAAASSTTSTASTGQSKPSGSNTSMQSKSVVDTGSPSFNPSASAPPSGTPTADAAQASSTDNAVLVTQKSTNVGAIAGGAVGGLLVLAALLGLFLCWRRRQRQEPIDFAEKSSYGQPSNPQPPAFAELEYQAPAQSAAPVAPVAAMRVTHSPQASYSNTGTSVVTPFPASPFADPGYISGRDTPNSSMTPRQAKLAAFQDSSHRPSLDHAGTSGNELEGMHTALPSQLISHGPPHSDAHTLIGTTITGTTAFADFGDTASHISSSGSAGTARGRWDQDASMAHRARALPTLPASMSEKPRLVSGSEKLRPTEDDDAALRDRVQMLEAEVNRLRHGSVMSEVPPAYATQ